jgi:hypothetical protein
MFGNNIATVNCGYVDKNVDNWGYSDYFNRYPRLINRFFINVVNF